MELIEFKKHLESQEDIMHPIRMPDEILNQIGAVLRSTQL